MPHMQPQPCEDGCCDDCPVGLFAYITEVNCKVHWESTNASQVDLISPWIQRDIGLNGSFYIKKNTTYRFRAYELDPDSYETCYVEVQVITDKDCCVTRSIGCWETIDENHQILPLPNMVLSVSGVVGPTDDEFGLVTWDFNCDDYNGSWVVEWNEGVEALIADYIEGTSFGETYKNYNNLTIDCPQYLYNNQTGIYEWYVKVLMRSQFILAEAGSPFYRSYTNIGCYWFKWPFTKKPFNIYNDPDNCDELFYDQWSYEDITPQYLELTNYGTYSSGLSLPLPSPAQGYCLPGWPEGDYNGQWPTVCNFLTANVNLQIL